MKSIWTAHEKAALKDAAELSASISWNAAGSRTRLSYQGEFYYDALRGKMFADMCAWLVAELEVSPRAYPRVPITEIAADMIEAHADCGPEPMEWYLSTVFESRNFSTFSRKQFDEEAADTPTWADMSPVWERFHWYGEAMEEIARQAAVKAESIQAIQEQLKPTF
jgi:hypothetical protein